MSSIGHFPYQIIKHSIHMVNLNFHTIKHIQSFGCVIGFDELHYFLDIICQLRMNKSHMLHHDICRTWLSKYMRNEKKSNHHNHGNCYYCA